MKEVLDKVKDSNLVDYQIGEIHVCYAEAYADIKVKSPNGINKTLRFEGILDFSMTNHQPWGRGCYICSSDVIVKEKSTIVQIQLNSGDCISLTIDGNC